MMKKAISIVLSMILILTCISFAAAEEAWTCPGCGAEVTGNFCSKCGTKKPDDGVWICPSCGAENMDNFCSTCGTKRPDGTETLTRNNAAAESADKIRLDLTIEFEKNSYFSTYDVKLFIDDEWITTMRHGVDLEQTLYLEPGKHIILFREDGSSYPSEGTTIVKLDEPSRYSCSIHTTMSNIEISSESLKTINAYEPELGGEKESVNVDGNVNLQVQVNFKKNAFFSQYDVDMYLDDVYIATLPHGKNYEGTLKVSKGKHVLVFYRSGGKSDRGAVSFSVDGDGLFSCKIEATRNGVDITKEKMSY